MQCVGQRYYQRKDVEFPNGEKLLKEWIRAETVALPPENFLALSFQDLTNRVEFIFERHVADTHCHHCVATFCFLLTPAVPSCCASSKIVRCSFLFCSSKLLFVQSISQPLEEKSSNTPT